MCDNLQNSLLKYKLYTMKNNYKNNNADTDFLLEVVNSITEGINSRSKKMLIDRFGLGKKSSLSLNQIGEKHNITRERVRQIINETINKIKQKIKTSNSFKKMEEKIVFAVKSKYGIISMEELLAIFARNKNEYGYFNFILFCSEKVETINSNNLVESVYFSDFDFKKLNKVYNIVENLLKKDGKVVKLKELFNRFTECSHISINYDNFVNFLKISKTIKKNVFGEWGLSEWKEVTPKNIRDKAYLVAKKENTPLHFRKLASLIDEYGLSNRKSHPQTVHNELIKDKKFVLVGRGTYALSEWGYKKGTVKDVIEYVLKKEKKSLSKREIIKRVLSVRNVKDTTVLINLNTYFKKIENDRYFLKK